MASEPPTERPCEILTVSRAQPFPLRYGRLTAPRRRGPRGPRTSSTPPRPTLLRRSPRASRAGRSSSSSSPTPPTSARVAGGSSAARSRSSRTDGSPPVAALKRARTLALRRARRVIVPSRYLAELAIGWGLDPARVVVVPQSRRRCSPSRRRRRGPARGLVFAGRLTRQKALHTALDARRPRSRAPSCSCSATGPTATRLERHAAELGLNGRVRFAGSVPRAEVLRALASAEALVLSSDWENFPHAAVEALALGTPLIATAVGGVPEIVIDGVNGLLVPPGAPDGSGARRSRRFLGSAGAAREPRGRGARLGRAPVGAARLRADRGAPRRGGGAVSAPAEEPLPRVLMVGRTRYTLPLPEWLARKFDALERQLDYRVLASAEEGSPIADDALPARPAEPSAPARRRALLPALSVPRPPPDQGVPPGSDHRREPVHRRRRDRRALAPAAARSRRSSSRCTATGGRRPGSTARRRASC